MQIEGIIQTINDYIFYNERKYKKIVQKKSHKFHIPKLKETLKKKGLHIFLYDKRKGGIFAYFISKGLNFDSSRKDYEKYQYYFDIQNFKEIKVINQDNVISLLFKKQMGLGYQKFKSWKTRGQPYFTLNKNMVKQLIEIIK